MITWRFLATALCVLSCAFPAKAQWSGNAELAAGLGGMEGSLVNDNKPMFRGLVRGNYQINYKTDHFRWGVKLDGEWEPKVTDNTRISYKKEKLGVVYKAASTRPLSVSLRSDLAWTPSPLRNYSAWVLYKYKNDRAYNHTMNAGGSEQDVQDFSYYYEAPVMDEHRVEAGGRTFRSFNDGRTQLHGFLSLSAVASERTNTWTVFKSEQGDGATAINVDDIEGYASMYRITPSSQDFDAEGDLHVQQTLLDGASSLVLTPGARLVSKLALDQNSGATRLPLDADKKDEWTWKDSTRLRESFNYLSLWAEPYIGADFKWKNLEAHANYALQVYARRLNDESHQQPLKVKGIYPVGKANVKWTISPSHSLNLTNQVSVSHPDYLKVCWYDRTAGYMDQLYRGNDGLFSPVTFTLGLEYTFKHERFLSQTGISYKSVVDEIDQTWSNEEIDGRQYKVFRWLNSSDSRGFGVTQKLGWSGKVIVANAAVTYNRSHRKAKEGDKVKDSHDWKLNSDVTAFLGKGWSVTLSSKYQSKVATFFTIFKEYCELNMRIQKDFKDFSLYLEGRDLLDQPRETSFESDELQEYWVEEVRSNRRLFILGARWKF